MLAKLSLRNAKRSMKDYSIYILTVTIIFALLYSFQMLAFSNDIKELADMMKAFQTVLIFVSCIIVFVVAWLVNYMNRFMLEKRGKELGTYMLLGISNRSITHMVLIENVIVGSIAFGLGVILGTFFYQIFLQIIMKIFEVPYEVSIPFSGAALGLTAVYALLSYVFSMFRMKRKLKKVRICDLIYLKNQNDKKSKKIINHWFVCIISIAFCIIGGYLFYQTCYELENLKRACIGILCFILGVYLFYSSLSSMLIKLNVYNKRRKYTKDHLFLMRNLSSKMKSMKMTLGTLALLLMIALTAFQNGLFMQTIFDIASETASPFDVFLMSTNEAYDVTPYDEYLKEQDVLKSSWSYPVYSTSDETLVSYLEEKNLIFTEEIPVIRHSDYQKIREIKGYPPIELEENRFLVHGYKEVYNILSKEPTPDIIMNGQTLQFQQVSEEPLPIQFENMFYVVSDDMVEELPFEVKFYVALTSKELTKEQCDHIYEIGGDTNHGPYVKLKKMIQTENNVQLVTFVFALFYIGFIFVCIVATILAVQQLSEATQYRYRYRILSNLGVESRQMNRLVFKQLSFYFGMPLILPVTISIWLTVCIHQIYRIYIDSSYVVSVIVRTLGLFLLVYLLYFIATYVGYIKSINKNKVREE